MITTGRCGLFHSCCGTRSLRNGQITRSAADASICRQTVASSVNNTTLGSCPDWRRSSQARWVKPLNADDNNMIFNERMTDSSLRMHGHWLLEPSLAFYGSARIESLPAQQMIEINLVSYGETPSSSRGRGIGTRPGADACQPRDFICRWTRPSPPLPPAGTQRSPDRPPPAL